MRYTMEKLAIIDMGSNSIRFVVMQIADNQSYSLLYQEKEAIRLGHGLSQTGVISEEGMQRALTCLHVYKHIMEVMDIHECRAVATAAVRNASNGEAFLQRINAETGITMEVISGEREAYLGYLGVINTIAMKDFLIFDLGGASVEMTLVRNGEAVHSLSVPIGAVTLTENLSSFADHDSVSGYAVPAMQWAVGQGFINGTDGKLLPTGTATRCQFAAILNRFTAAQSEKA